MALGLLHCGLIASQICMAASRPNILIFFADDVGVGDIRTYNNHTNNPGAALPPELPNLEKLADQGMVFTNASTPAGLCAPNRYCILAGNYPWRGSAEGGSWHFNKGSQFLSGQKSIAVVLNEVGYHTAMFGKVHLGGRVWPKEPNANDPAEITNWDKANPHYNPNKPADIFDFFAADFTRQLYTGLSQQGFDYSYLTYGGIQGGPYMFFENDFVVPEENPTDPNDPTKDFIYWEGDNYANDNGSSQIFGSVESYGMPSWKTNEVGPILTQKTIDFIDRHHSDNLTNNTDTPFFIHYCAQAVHVPHTPPIDFLGTKVAGETGDGDHADMLLEIDVAYGKIEQALADRGLLEDTLIIFTSDNGGLKPNVQKSTHDSNEGLRGYKATIYEGGHRVPFIVKWGDGSTANSPIKPATTAPQLTSILDIYQTLSELVDNVQGEDQGLDSVSFLSVLNSASPANQPEFRESVSYLGTRFIDDSLDPESAHRAIIIDGWKLVAEKASPHTPKDLYQLSVDPTEANNLINDASQADRIDAMHLALTNMLNSSRSTAAPTPSDTSNDSTPPSTNPMAFTGKPQWLGDDSIWMQATIAYDQSGPVEYKFRELSGNGTSSDWQTSPYYTDTNIDPTLDYSYRVRARDLHNNKTSWSEIYYLYGNDHGNNQLGDLWEIQYYGSAGSILPDEPVSGWAGNAFGAYAFASDPDDTIGPAIQSGLADDTNLPTFSLIRSDDQRIIWQVSTSTDLTNWQTITEGADYSVSTSDQGNNQELATITLTNTNEDKVFLRITAKSAE